MKKSKLLALLTAVMLIINTLFISVPAFADTTTSTVTRFDGANRYEVAVNVSKATYPNGTSAVILVNGSDATLADGLAAAPLAKALNAPILLTDKNSVPAVTAAEITRLGADKVYVVGGSGSVSDSIVSEYSATRIGGANRYEVAKNVAEELKAALGVTSFSSAFVCNGLKYADALAAAPFAAAKGEPILFVTANANDSTTQATVSELSSLGVTATDAIGGSASLPDAVVSAVNGTRVNGANRAALSAAIAAKYASAPTGAYVVNGYKPADALAVGPLAAVKGYPVLFVDSNGTSVDAAVTNYYKSNASTITTLVPVGGTASVSDTAVAAVKNGNPTTGLAVSSVTAVAANQIKVVFNKAVGDTSKVTFDVKRSTVPVTVSATWNSTYTEATLTASSNFVEGTYTVNVKNDTTDLGSTSVAISKQKVAKIEILSDTVARIADNEGYANYKVLDQYGNDITGSGVASGIQWTSSATSITAKNNGILDIIQGTNSTNNFTTIRTVVITAVCPDSAVTATKTLDVALMNGTLSDIKLNQVVNKDNKVLTMGDTTDKFYIDYTAKDNSGNITNNYDLLNNGLMFSDATSTNHGMYLYSSNSSVLKAKLVQDPSDNTKGLIELELQQNSISFDTTVVITAITKSGTVSSTLNVDIKKAKALDSIQLLAPTTEISVGDTNVEIPFVAYDQDGNAITKYSDINGKIDLSVPTSYMSLNMYENSDGTARFVADFNGTSLTSATTLSLTVLVKDTGKSSVLTLNVRDKAVPTSFSIDTSKVKTYVTYNTDQHFDFGSDNGGLSVKDQYGRNIDLTKVNKIGGYYYFVFATANGSTVALDPKQSMAYLDKQIHFLTNTPTTNKNDNFGSTTFTFKLYKTTDSNFATDYNSETAIEAGLSAATPNIFDTGLSQSMTMTKVDYADVTNFKIDDGGTIYAIIPRLKADSSTPTDVSDATGYVAEWNTEPGIHGYMSNGTEVAISADSIANGGNVVQTAIDNTSDFILNNASAGDVSRKVFAKQLDNNRTSASTILTVIVNDANNKPHVLTSTIKSSTETRYAKSMGLSVTTNTTNASGEGVMNGITQSGDTININLDTINSLGDLSKVIGTSMLKYHYDGSTYTTAGQGWIYFTSTDQYGKDSFPIPTIYVNNSTKVAGVNKYAVDPTTGILTCTSGTPAAGDFVEVTAVTSNGLSKTIRINFN